MSDTPSSVPEKRAADEIVAAIRQTTPARVLVGRAGLAYSTRTQLELRRDHAAARDAVETEVDLQRDFPQAFLKQFPMLEVRTMAVSKPQYLMRPDLGRRFDAASRKSVTKECSKGVDLQIVIGDGLSARAVTVMVPELLPHLCGEATRAGWTLGRCIFIRHCRVGILNDIGELLDPVVVVLLIGERPGLATAESLSAYMAYRPRPGHTDAQRNLISNIHSRGVPADVAARRIVALAAKMRTMQTSGVAVKEDADLLAALPSLPPGISARMP